MVLSNDKAEKLVKEGIELSFDVINGIQNAKKKKMMTLLLSLAIVLVLIVGVLCLTGHLVYALPVGAVGIIGLVVLFLYNMKALTGLKKELDTLYHYINY
ncbi:MAG: hypothetical protein IJ801_00920 [Lachnospiraceae bacterium]|nr:hypothetical protein [Lachnospiraceae bacterium]